MRRNKIINWDNPMPQFAHSRHWRDGEPPVPSQLVINSIVKLQKKETSLEATLFWINTSTKHALKSVFYFPGIVHIIPDDPTVHFQQLCVFPSVRFTDTVMKGNALQLAVIFGQYVVAKALLDKGLSHDSYIPRILLSNLDISIMRKDTKMVDLSLSTGFFPNDPVNHKLPPLSRAIIYESFAVAKLLLEKGANPNGFSVYWSWQGQNRHPLMLAKTTEMIDLLILHHSDPNFPITQIVNLMHGILRFAPIEQLHQMMEYGGDIFRDSREGVSPIEWLAQESYCSGSIPQQTEKERVLFGYELRLQKHHSDQRALISKQFQHSNPLFSRTGKANKRLRFC